MNELAVAIAIVLFPGLIATVIADKLIVHYAKWGTFKYGIYSFVFGVGCYVAVQVLATAWNCLPDGMPDVLPIQSRLDVWSLVAPNGGKSTVDLVEVMVATLFAPFAALLAAYLVNHKMLNRLAKRLSISQKYGDENLFSFYLNSQEITWIYVRDREKGLTYQGMVVSYSESESMQELVLAHVTVFGYEDSEEYYKVPSVYLTKPMGTFVIEAVPNEFLGGNGNGKEAN